MAASALLWNQQPGNRYRPAQQNLSWTARLMLGTFIRWTAWWNC